MLRIGCCAFNAITSTVPGDERDPDVVFAPWGITSFRRNSSFGVMCEPLSNFDISTLLPDDVALLLDLDGTLAPIAEHPAAVVVADRTKQALAALDVALDGAVAIISGRSIDDVDRLVAPDRFAVAGIHGLMRRDIHGRLHETAFDEQVLQAVTIELQRLVAGSPGVWLEAKPGSVALHYRQRPDLEGFCREQVSRAVAGHEPAEVLAGKMVIEIKAAARTKGDAVVDFMAEAPFCGRCPIYAGDDVTDEDAFRAVAKLGGRSIRIGSKDSRADYWAAETDAFLHWLSELSIHLAATSAASMPETR